MKNNKKLLDYIGIGVVTVLLVGSLAIGFVLSSPEEVIIEGDFEQYRSSDIPEDCRLPDYDNEIVKWVEHLGHHEETRFCLEYFE